MKKWLFFFLELCIEIPRWTYLYLRNQHRAAVSDKLEEAMKGGTKEILVYLKAGGYDWSRRNKLEKALRDIGVTRIKHVICEGDDALIAVLTSSQIGVMVKKRWLPRMSTVGEMFAREEARLRSDFDTYKRFSQDQLKSSLQELSEKYQL